MSLRTSEENSNWLEIAQVVLRAEAYAITVAAERLNGGSLTKAANLILAHSGKVVISGIGKSGHVGQKLAATLRSTGTPAVFLHAAEAVHGDLGVYTLGDPTILISRSGSTAELLRLIPILRHLQSPLIAVLGNLESPLACQADVVLDARVKREADPLNMAPTCSSAVALALGDALAIVLMHARRFTEQDFAQYHPSGQLGRSVRLCVSDVMHSGDNVAWVHPNDSLRCVVIKMTTHPLGASCVVDEEFNLMGLITDGDLRRALQAYDDIRPLCANDIMTRHPITILPHASLKEALHLMEDRSLQISVLPVVNQNKMRCLGLIRLHDIYQPEIT